VGAQKASLVPLTSERLNVLADHSKLALSAFRGSPLCPFSLAADAPGVAVLFDVSHSVLKRVSAFGAEEMSMVPMFPEGDNMFS